LLLNNIRSYGGHFIKDLTDQLFCAAAQTEKARHLTTSFKLLSVIREAARC